MHVTAFSPAHLTGIFKIYPTSSAGAGVTLSEGMTTTVSVASRSVRPTNQRTSISINDTPSPAPVSRFVLSKYFRHLPAQVSISHKTSLPIGCGLGMSAAGALSLSLALNEFCGNPFSRAMAIKIAHDADVVCGTGLASVDVQAIGGLVSRKRGSGKPDRLALSASALRTPVHLAIYAPLLTSSIIRAKGWKEKVNAAGTSSLAEFYKSRTMENLAACSNHFAIESTLGKWAGKFLRTNPTRPANPVFGMAMLGKTLFCVGKQKPHFPKISALPAPSIIVVHPTNAPASIVL